MEYVGNEPDVNTQDSHPVPEDESGVGNIPSGVGNIPSGGNPFLGTIPSTLAIPHNKIAWSIPVEIIFDKNEKRGIDEALSKGKFSIIIDKEAAGSALKNSKRKHKGTSTLHVCQVCNKEFKEKKRFLRHKLAHSSEKAHRCKECNKSFKHLWTLSKHIKMKHSCELNEPSHTPLTDTDSLEEDEPKKENVKSNSGGHKSNSGGQIHTCLQCEKKFPYASHLVLHLKTHDGIKDLHCTEPNCGKMFKSSSHLNDHIRGHNKGFVCKVCQEGYRSRSALQYHITKVHTPSFQSTTPSYQANPGGTPSFQSIKQKKCYLCELCGKVFKYKKRDPHLHALSHKKNGELDVMSGPYTMSFTKIRGTKLQINEGDAGGDLTNFVIPFEKVGKTTWYHCNKCARRFYSAPSIMSHIYTTHNKDLTTVTLREKESTLY